MTETLRELVEALGARFSIADAADILLVAGGIYGLLKLIEGRRASQIAFGTVIVGGLLVLSGSSQLGLGTVQWIVRETLPLLPIAIIVLYQSEIRNGLAQIGRGGMSLRNPRRPLPEQTTLGILVKAASELSRRQLGAIVVWQGTTGLKGYADTGATLDARLSTDLLLSIFHTASPLHDGAVIVSGSKIVAARCVLPLSRREDVAGGGTRHRAAMGVAEETDATVLVVSEETGHASVISGSRIVAAANPADLQAELARARHTPLETGGGEELARPLSATGAVR